VSKTTRRKRSKRRGGRRKLKGTRIRNEGWRKRMEKTKPYAIIWPWSLHT
jgi:hypothetical protein